MTSHVAGLDLVERQLDHGRLQLALVDRHGAEPIDACELTIDPLELHDGVGGLVRVDGIGNVLTRDSHRRRGLASALMRSAVDRMRDRGAAASLLYGIDDFYDRFDYHSCGDERWVRVRLDSIDATRADDRATTRTMRPDDADAIADLYETLAARTAGAASRRGGRVWSMLRESEVLVVEREDAIVGWAWRGAGDVPERDAVAQRQPDAIAFAELQALDAGGMLALLAGVREWIKRDDPDATELVTGACEDTTLRAIARVDWIAGTLVDEVRPTGGAMLLVLDEPAAATLTSARELYQFLPDRF